MNRISSARALTLAAAAALAAFALLSCDDNPTENDSAKLRIAAFSGNGQNERPGVTLPAPLVVKVTDILGDPRSGITVLFRTSDAGAHATPSVDVTGADGLASCRFQLGTAAGAQHVLASIEEDSTVFDETAVAPACPEESPTGICPWPAGHIFIATTSSSELSAAGTVILDYDPMLRGVTKILETTDLLDGISFSPRGELFVSAPGKVWKVNRDLLKLDDFVQWGDNVTHVSLDPNVGSILTGCTIWGPAKIGCPAEGFEHILGDATFDNNVVWQNLAVDPVTRDVYFISEFSPTNYALWRVLWDGRSPVRSFDVVANLSVGAASPAGMCIDSTGTVYIVFDGNDNYRRIVRVASGGEVNYDFFNFYTHYGSNSQLAGRWGDIVCSAGKLYVIDTRNDRLVIISRSGAWLDEVKNTAFSHALVENEHYSICAAPLRLCPN